MQSLSITGTDNTTELTFAPLTGSAGDGKPAVWRLQSTNPAFPISASETLEITSRFNGPKTVRRVEVKLTVPLTETDVNTGKVTVTDRLPVVLTVPVLQGASPATAALVADRIKKLVNNWLVVEQMTSGYAAV